MKLITDPLRQLVQRKLWPVALLLIAALVAVPMTLAKEPEPISVAPAHGAKEEGMPATFVSAVEESADPERRRRVLGQSKDPFEPAELPKAKKAKKPKAEEKAEDKAASEDKPADKGPSGGSAPAAPAPTPTVTFPANSMVVGFGLTDSSGDLPLQLLERMQALPSEEHPVIVFTGFKDHGKTAVFMITGTVTAQGDGKCDPKPEDCQTLRLRKGETEFLDITGTGEETDGQYQLDAVALFPKKTVVPVTSAASAADVAAGGGEKILRRAVRGKLFATEK